MLYTCHCYSETRPKHTLHTATMRDTAHCCVYFTTQPKIIPIPIIVYFEKQWIHFKIIGMT